MDPPQSPNASSIPAQSPAATVRDDAQSPLGSTSRSQLPKPPSFKLANGQQTASNMTQSSTPLGNINAARRSGLPQNVSTTAHGSQLPQDVQARMKAFHLSRQRPPPQQSATTTAPSERAISGSTIPLVTDPRPGDINMHHHESPKSPDLRGPSAAAPGVVSPSRDPRPAPANFNSAPVVRSANASPAMGLAAKRGLKLGMKLSDATGPPMKPLERETDVKADKEARKDVPAATTDSLFNKYAEYVDTATGTLNFKGKATVHGQGIDFSSGTSFHISLDEVDTLDELGKGNYGTVFKVRHSRPRIRRPGQGLGGNRARASPAPEEPISENRDIASRPIPVSSGQTTGLIMAMKEIRLELDDAKFAAIIMELDILHRCVSSFIVDFYGAFFQEGAVYICMEFMDGGSIDKLYGNGVPEAVLRKITLSTILGLKALKDEHNIIHRDVKPTNILVNTKGQVKICDFGVSGNLVASIAKTNIGCQSYMAPERISGGGVAQAGANPGGGTYSVQSDIWSLGLTIIECGMGQYPYPPETYDNIFSQLSAIVDGDPPDLPADRFSETARDFVRGALNKIPKLRPTYAMLLRHPWLSQLLKPPTIVEESEGEVSDAVEVKLEHGPTTDDPQIASWVIQAVERRDRGTANKHNKAPALHAAPLSPP